jgi:DNA-binding beta-propeller fold protein YncE
MRNGVTVLVLGAALATLSLACGCALRSSNFTPPAQSTEDFGAARSAFAKDLFVTDKNAVDILANGSWKNIGHIAKGSDARADWVDKEGNLYLTSVTHGQAGIMEYKPGMTKPTFTYSKGIKAPFSISTDGQGHVYEADFQGFVLEYAQREHRVLNKCALSGGNYVTGVAVNASGAVFVVYTTGLLHGGIVEYPAGLHGCHETKLKPKLSYPYGIVVDAQGNLVIADSETGRVHIIAPPFDKITTTWGTIFYQPVHLTIDTSNLRAFVTEIGKDVKVVGYPRGKLFATLDSSHGLNTPYDAVDGENFVP